MLIKNFVKQKWVLICLGGMPLCYIVHHNKTWMERITDKFNYPEGCGSPVLAMEVKDCPLVVLLTMGSDLFGKPQI